MSDDAAGRRVTERRLGDRRHESSVYRGQWRTAIAPTSIKNPGSPGAARHRPPQPLPFDATARVPITWRGSEELSTPQRTNLQVLLRWRFGGGPA